MEKTLRQLLVVSLYRRDSIYTQLLLDAPTTKEKRVRNKAPTNVGRLRNCCGKRFNLACQAFGACCVTNTCTLTLDIGHKFNGSRTYTKPQAPFPFAAFATRVTLAFRVCHTIQQFPRVSHLPYACHTCHTCHTCQHLPHVSHSPYACLTYLTRVTLATCVSLASICHTCHTCLTRVSLASILPLVSHF